jgi:multidrug efflux pump subunit AcrA (membrane-fusion protein)
MNLKRIIPLLGCVALLLPSGCSRQGEKPTAEATPVEAVASFNAKSGLLVPPETAKFIGLKIADVEERQMSAALEFSAQVYQAANEAQFASLQPKFAVEARASGALSSAQSALLREGQPVTVKAEGKEILSGRIEAVKHGVGASNVLVEILLSITDSQARLPKGTFVSVSASLDGQKSVVSVPRAALLRTAEGDFVYTVSGERFVRASIKLGVINHEWVEVTDGLYAGDQIVVTPVMTLWMAELQSLRGGKACADGH